jgi:hypothetical protein
VGDETETSRERGPVGRPVKLLGTARYQHDDVQETPKEGAGDGKEKSHEARSVTPRETQGVHAAAVDPRKWTFVPREDSQDI